MLPGTSVKFAVVRLCIEATWKFTLPSTPPNVRSRALLVESRSRRRRLFTPTRSSTSLKERSATSARSVENRSKPSSDFAPTSPDIRGQNRMLVAAVAGRSQIGADLQSTCEQFMRSERSMPARLAGKPRTVWTTFESTCGLTETQSL